MFGRAPARATRGLTMRMPPQDPRPRLILGSSPPRVTRKSTSAQHGARGPTRKVHHGGVHVVIDIRVGVHAPMHAWVASKMVPPLPPYLRPLLLPGCALQRRVDVVNVARGVLMSCECWLLIMTPPPRTRDCCCACACSCCCCCC